ARARTPRAARGSPRTPPRSDRRPRPSGRRAGRSAARRGAPPGWPRDTSPASRRVHVLRHVLDRLPRRRLRERDRGLEVRLDGRREGGELGIREQRRRPEPGGERRDWIPALPLLDLRLRAVELRIGHRVRAEAIRARLEEAWAAVPPDGV